MPSWLIIYFVTMKVHVLYVHKQESYDVEHTYPPRTTEFYQGLMVVYGLRSSEWLDV